MHARQQIRKAIVSMLHRASPLWSIVCDTRLPTRRVVGDFLMVFSDGEASRNDGDDWNPAQARTANISVIGRLGLPGNSDTSSVEDKMDAVAEAIETTLTFATLQAVLPEVKSLALVNTEMTVITDETDQPMHAEISLNYVAEYAIQEGEPSLFI